MTITKLEALEAALRESIAHDDRDGIRDAVTSLCAELGIAWNVGPADVARDSMATQLIVRVAELLATAPVAEPASLCGELIVCAAIHYGLIGEHAAQYRLVKSALAFARRGESKHTLRRCLNNMCGAAHLSGNALEALEYSIAACRLARELNDVPGLIGGLCNGVSALYWMGLHREGIFLTDALTDDQRFPITTSMKTDVANGLAQRSTGLLQTSQYSAALHAATRAIAWMGPPTVPVAAWNRSTTEATVVRAAVHIGEMEIARQSLGRIAELADAFPEVSRIRMIHEHALAAMECGDGAYAAAIGRLLNLAPRTSSIFSLHVDTLTLLREAYQAAGDHANAMACLAEQVQHRSRDQTARVAEMLSDLGTTLQTSSPAHDMAANVIDALRKQPTPAPAAVSSDAGSAQQMQEVFERLAVAAELNEDDSGRHGYRVGKLAGLLATALGFSAADSERVELAGRLHDIGKLGLPGTLLARKEPLTSAEHKVMREHVETGRTMLAQAKHTAFDWAMDVALHHHERWDGSGYPQQLRGEAIPEVARIVAIAEAFDVMTHGRDYQPALTFNEALARILDASGAHFEPRIVTAFTSLLIRLRAQHGDDLNEFLGTAANASSFIQARASMQALMASL